MSEQRKLGAFAEYALPGAPHEAAPQRRAPVGAGLATEVVRDTLLNLRLATAFPGPFVRGLHRLSRWACWLPQFGIQLTRNFRSRHTLAGTAFVPQAAAARQTAAIR